MDTRTKRKLGISEDDIITSKGPFPQHDYDNKSSILKSGTNWKIVFVRLSVYS